MKNPWIIIPTYCEQENIRNMIPELLAQGIENVDILIVDDNSPDGTADEVQKHQEAHSNVHLLSRKLKSGLGTAYVDGFQYALDHGASSVIQMDADFSHDPKDVPRLLEALIDHDVAIGSRYIDGVRVIDWPIERLILSYAANKYARIVTGLPYFDITGGFRAWKKEIITKINPKTVRVDGYGFQIAVAYRAWRVKASIVEVPIVFSERRVGRSKLNSAIFWESLFLVWKLRLERLFHA